MYRGDCLPSFVDFMPRLKNRLHERFAWLIAEGLDRSAAYRKLHPGNTAAARGGHSLYHRPEIKERIAEIQGEIHGRAVAALDHKRDLLRQMIEGSIPTKVVRKGDKVEATFDRLAALTVDAKLAGEFAEDQKPQQSDIKLTFEMYPRNHPNPPKAWMEAELIVPEPVDHPADGVPTLDCSQFLEAPLDQPDLESFIKNEATTLQQ